MHLHENDRPRSDEVNARPPVKIMVQLQGGGYCAVCCRPWANAEGGYRIGVSEPGPAGHGNVHHIEYLLQERRWRLYQNQTNVVPWATYTLDTQTGYPCFSWCTDCLSIASFFFDTRVNSSHRSRSGAIHDPVTLYTHLRRQFLKDVEAQTGTARLLWSHNGFVGEEMEWSWNDTAMEWVPDSRHAWLQGRASSPIPSLSTYIISQLKPLSSESLQQVSFLKQTKHASLQPNSRICHIPAEITAMIVGYLDLANVFTLRETSHHFSKHIPLNQWFWFSRFVNKELFGFIFAHESQDVIADIEAKVIKRGLLPDKMDWIRLIKELSSFSSFTESGCFCNAPPRFRNRRRIWKILETMEIDGQESIAD